MPWLEIVLGFAATGVVGLAVIAIRSRQQQQMQLRRSQNKRLEEAQVTREWEDLQARLRGSRPA
jgi:hypothetical protein